MELVSAIITTHNRCHLLKCAIDSVMNQTYRPIELIIVNDASTDDTDYYMRSLNNNDIKYIEITKENSKGGNYARNVGVQNSSGTYIAFLDDDDEWFSKKIEKQMKVFRAKNNVGIVYCGINVCYEKDKLYEVVLPPIICPTDCSKLILQNGLSCNTSTIIMKREIFNMVGGFDEGVKRLQEHEFLMRACQKTLLCAVNEPLILYNASNTRLSNNTAYLIDSINYILKKHEQLLKILSTKQKRKSDIYFLKYIHKSYLTDRTGLVSEKISKKIIRISLLAYIEDVLSVKLEKNIRKKIFIKHLYYRLKTIDRMIFNIHRS